MRWREIVKEGGMSDLAMILDDLKEIKTAKVSLDPQSNTVYLDFVLNGEPGKMRVVQRPMGTRDETHREFRKKVFAAARAENRGRAPGNWEQAVQMASGPSRPMALKILTNPKNWKLDGLSHGGFKF